MFGDFMTLAMDQIINHASKFHHMFNKKVSCPVVFRSPMGGGRGYGPTHSQSLERFLIGIDNIKTLSLNSLIDPTLLYNNIIANEVNPVIVLENKTDYGRKVGPKSIKNYITEISNHTYPVIRVKPIISVPTATIVTYGGMADTVLNSLEQLFIQTDLKCEVLIITQIHPIPIDVILESVQKSLNLITIEEGPSAGSVGSEIISSVIEKTSLQKCLRISGLPVPIPSVKSLENKVIPDIERIVNEIKQHFNATSSRN